MCLCGRLVLQTVVVQKNFNHKNYSIFVPAKILTALFVAVKNFFCYIPISKYVPGLTW